MTQLTGDQLIGDVFDADQGTAGAAGPNSDGSYLYQATTTLSQYGGKIVITAGSGETVTAKVVGGSHDGEVYTGTIVANDASDFLVETDLAFVYVTNDPAAQPVPPADPNGPPGPDSSRTVGALGPNNTYVYAAPVCFASGTSIRTERGDVAVEDLVIDDVVVTAAGDHCPIRWLGHRTIQLEPHRFAANVSPVRISADAFGPGRPARDLLVSPGHAVCIEIAGEVLIPAGALVNGASVRQADVSEVTYWHVELDRHDILLAENLPCESYFDMGNRSFFTETDVVDLRTGPDRGAARHTHADFCRPFFADGPIVDAARARLIKRARASARARAA